MSKFTPGPWRIEGEFIATDVQNIAEIIPDTGSDEEITANARLIAAAPIMYSYIARKAQEGDSNAAKIIASLGGTDVPFPLDPYRGASPDHPV